MPNPTRQEIIDAHNALDALYKRAAKIVPNSALKTYVLKALPPKPTPTMAEVKWDDDKHYLAEAEHPTSGKVVMVFYTEDTYIYVLVTDEDETYGYLASPSNLTPTGKRYTLTEVQE